VSGDGSRLFGGREGAARGRREKRCRALRHLVVL